MKEFNCPHHRSRCRRTPSWCHHHSLPRSRLCGHSCSRRRHLTTTWRRRSSCRHSCLRCCRCLSRHHHHLRSRPAPLPWLRIPPPHAPMPYAPRALAAVRPHPAAQLHRAPSPGRPVVLVRPHPATLLHPVRAPDHPAMPAHPAGTHDPSVTCLHALTPPPTCARVPFLGHLAAPCARPATLHSRACAPTTRVPRACVLAPSCVCASSPGCPTAPARPRPTASCRPCFARPCPAAHCYVTLSHPVRSRPAIRALPPTPCLGNPRCPVIC